MESILRKIYRKLFPSSTVSDLRKRGLIVGSNFSMQKEVIIDYSHCWHIEIGDDVTLAPRVVILAHDASTKKALGYTRIGKVRIGSRVFVGAGSIVLPGVSIGDDVVIGAGSVVSRDVPSGVVAVGNPAREVRGLEDYLQEKRKEFSGSPCFDETYTTRGNITNNMKHEMNRRMKNGIGYVV